MPRDSRPPIYLVMSANLSETRSFTFLSIWTIGTSFLSRESETLESISLMPMWPLRFALCMAQGDRRLRDLGGFSGRSRGSPRRSTSPTSTPWSLLGLMRRTTASRGSSILFSRDISSRRFTRIRCRLRLSLVMSRRGSRWSYWGDWWVGLRVGKSRRDRREEGVLARMVWRVWLRLESWMFQMCLWSLSNLI